MSDSVSAVRKSLSDVAAAVLTPFDESGDVRHEDVARHAAFLSERGINLVLACANVSEYHSLTVDERIAVVETVVDAVSNDTTVLAGTGGSLRTAVETANAQAAAGADAHMVMPPDNAFVHEEGLVSYYEEFAVRAQLPLVPYVRGIEPSPETVAAVARIPEVAGVKYALGDVEQFARTVSMVDDDTVWVCGMGEPPAPVFWLEGATGFTSGVGNFRPVVGLALLEELRNGEWDRALSIRNAAVPIQQLRQEAGTRRGFVSANSIPVLKECLTLAGLDGGHVRPPLTELTDETRARVREEFERLDEFVQRELSPVDSVS